MQILADAPLLHFDGVEEILFEPFFLRDVKNRSQDGHAFGCRDRDQTDFDGDFAAALMPREQFTPHAHGPRFGVFHKTSSVADVDLTEPLRQQHVDRLPQQLRRRKAGNIFGFGIAVRNVALGINQENTHRKVLNGQRE